MLVLLVLLLTSCGGGGYTDDATDKVAPTDSAGVNQSVVTSTLVTLDGNASSDSDGDLISYQWSVSSKPLASSLSSITNNTAVEPTFTVDSDGTYVISLIVNDGQLAGYYNLLSTDLIGKVNDYLRISFLLDTFFK